MTTWTCPTCRVVVTDIEPELLTTAIEVHQAFCTPPKETPMNTTHPRILVTNAGVTVEKDPHTAPIHIPSNVLAANTAKANQPEHGGITLLTITLLCQTFDVEQTPRAFWAPDTSVIDEVVGALTAAGFTITPPPAVGTIESGLISVKESEQ